MNNDQLISQGFIHTDGLSRHGRGVSLVSRFSDAGGREFEYEEPVFEVIPRLVAASYEKDSRAEAKRVASSDLLPCCHFYLDASDFAESSYSEYSESDHFEHRAVWKVSQRKDIADVVAESSIDHVTDMINWSSSIIVHSPDLLITLIESEDRILAEYPEYFAERAKEWSQYEKDKQRIEALDIIFGVPGIISHLVGAIGTIELVIKSVKSAPKMYKILREYATLMKDILSPKKWNWKKLVDRGFIDNNIGLLKVGDELTAKEYSYFYPSIENAKIKISNSDGDFESVQGSIQSSANILYKSPTEAARHHLHGRSRNWSQTASLNGFIFWNTQHYGTLDEARDKFIEAGKFRTII